VTPDRPDSRPLVSGPLDPQSETDEPLPSCDEIMDLLLNLFESHKVAALALQMVEKRRQAYKLARTAPVGTMIIFLAVDRRVDMLIQRLKALELPMAEITLEAVAIPCRTCRDVFGGSSGECEQLHRDQTTGIALLNRVVYCFPSKTPGLRT